ncbi:MAG: GreA/GreB family elongation factor [Tepidisphaeraceae bacterium]
MKLQKALITERDSEQLLALLGHLRETGEAQRECLDRLATRLEAATVIDVEDIPRSVVTMNSLVGLRDLAANEKFSCTLAYPDQADVVKHKVAVTVPLGADMLGSRVGDTIECPVPSGVRTLRVERVFYQPEAARDFHL